jgi:hypothetical protein
MIEKYIALRDKIHNIKEDHKKQLAPYTDALAKLEGFLLIELDRAGVDSMKAEAGTVYKSTATSVTVQDWVDTLEFIREHRLWDLLEARVSKTAALAVIEERKAPIPGVQVSQAVSLHVRRS